MSPLSKFKKWYQKCIEHGTSNPEHIAQIVLESQFESYNQETVKKITYPQFNLFQSPLGYVDWNTHLMFCLMQSSDWARQESLASKDLTGINIGMISYMAINYRAPARYISKELCEAFIETPVNSFGNEIAEILPAIHIMLPRNYLFDHDGEEIVSLVVYAQKEASPEEYEEATKSHRRLLSLISDKEKTNFSNEPGVWVCAFSRTSVAACCFPGIDPEYNLPSRSSEEKDFYEKMGRIAINSLLVHLYEPELVSVDAKPVYRTNGFAKHKGKDPLPATWIGKTFKVQRESSSPNDGSTPRGTCRPHWRRGHWHTVVCGKGRKERKSSWFRPVYVNS
jgi:hypothetical protein